MQPAAERRTPTAPPLTLPRADRAIGQGPSSDATAFSGSASVSIPIPLPSARGAPELTLAYAQGTDTGPFGLGFGLSVPVVVRDTARSIPRYDDSDQFLGPGGERLTPGLHPDGRGGWAPEQRSEMLDGVTYEVRVYRARTDPGPGRLERWTAPDGACFWKLLDADAGVATFGYSAGARVADPEEPLRVVCWLLEEEVDAVGNVVRYTYKAEDGAGWSGWTPPGGFAQRYPERVRYGNYKSQAGSETFAFEVIFDYGEYDELAPTPQPVRPWPVRADPSMSCRAGFAVQTLRLCRGVLVVNRIPEPAGAAPRVTSVLRLRYDEDPVHSRLASATHIGVRGTERAELPALELTYAAFDLAAARWRSITLPDGSAPTSALAGPAPDATLADLHGEGLPGVLVTTPDGPSYHAPLGGGVVGPPQPLPSFPDLAGAPAPLFAWRDVRGDGHLSLVLFTGAGGGYFYNDNEGGWRSLQPFASFPAEATSSAARWTDVNGDGRADLMVQLPGALRCYLDEGGRGLGPPLTTQTAAGFPILGDDGASTLVTFADVLGDGLAHCVRVADRSISVWPNLGYGRFGPAYAMRGAPALDAELTTDRILLADVSGSGRADLLLLYPDHVVLHQNHGGFGFGPAIRVPIPGGLGPLDRVDVADVEGSGRVCLVVSQGGPEGATRYLDFAPERYPYLLTSVANGMGASTSFRYTSSTELYLTDRARGSPWTTRLASPVVVVERIEHDDAVDGVSGAEVRRYRDGYYDTTARVFRGFAYVETLTGGAPGQQRCLTKEWFDVGLPELARRLRSAQFQPALDAGPSALLPPIPDRDAATLREAQAAGAGALLHSEVYAADDDGAPAPVPLETSDHSYSIELVQPPLDGHAGSFRVLPREAIAVVYEGVAADPRVEQEALLAWDACGQPTRWATAFYGREQPQAGGQEAVRAILYEQDYVSIDQPELVLRGVVWQTRESELGGLPAGARLGYAALASQVSEALGPGHRIPYGADFTGGPQARLFRHDQILFWDAGLTAPAPVGESGPQALVHHHREAVFPIGFEGRAYGSRVDADLLRSAGYRKRDGYWWRDGTTVSYFGSDGFYHPRAFREPFQTAKTATTVAYDQPYWLFATTVTDGHGFASEAEPDYHAMEPRDVTNVNGVVTQGLYDPLGRLTVIAQHADVQGAYRGDMDLKAYTRQPVPTAEQLAADPDRYLQGARMFFLQDLAGRPPCMASVQSNRHVDSARASKPASPPLVTLTYLDGFGRTLEALERVESAAEAGASRDDDWVWVSTDRVEYDDRGRAMRSYLPAFSSSPAYAAPTGRHCSTYSYDALGRLIREDLPKGFFTRTEHATWRAREFDADDTVKDSRYYRKHINDPSLPPNERRALQMAAGFFDTPSVLHEDAQGLTIQVDELEAGGSAVPTYIARDIRGLVTSVADARHGPRGANVTTLYDMLERPLKATRVDAGETQVLPDATDAIVRRWTARGEEVITQYDYVLQQPLRVLAQAAGAPAVVETYAYGTDPSTLSVHRLTTAEDQAGRLQIAAYDLDAEPARTSWRFVQRLDGIVDWTDPTAVPLLADTWTCGWERDPEGRTRVEHCPDGSSITYTRHANGWLAAIGVDGAAQAISGVKYIAAGQPASAAYANGVALRWRYDELTLGLAKCAATVSATGKRLQRLAYTRDPVGNVCTVEDRAAATILGGPDQVLAKQYTFDALYRLRAASGWESADATPWRDYHDSYSYDPAGNLLAIDHEVGGNKATRAFSVAGTSNRAVTTTMLAGGRTIDSYFDAAGNLVELEDGTTLVYDVDQRLATVTPPATITPEAWYRYDRDGVRRRRRVQVGGANAEDAFLVGSTYVLAGPGDHSFAQVVSGLFDELLLVERDSSGTLVGVRFLVSDALGSVTVQADSAGALLSYEDFRPYGERGVRLEPGSPPPVALGFAGKERDVESGLVYFGARHYVPAWGRWLTPDPLGELGGLNLYEYVQGNPVTAYDAEGLFPRGFKVTTVQTYGSGRAQFLSPGFAGDIQRVRVKAGAGTITGIRWVPQPGNTGKSLTRRYPVTNKGYRGRATAASLKPRRGRSMFRSVPKGKVGYLRGHGIPHADTARNRPARGGVISTLDPENYYPEPEGWGEQARARREAKARKRGTPVAHFAEYASNPDTTDNGTPIPTAVWFVELTGLSQKKSYAARKATPGRKPGALAYNIKAYKIVYSTFNYDSLPRKDPNSDRRAIKRLRVTTVPLEILALLYNNVPRGQQQGQFQ